MLQTHPIKSRNSFGVIAGLVGIALATPLSTQTLSAQEFRAPQVQPAQANHAAALKAQMLRVQSEQGAAPGFAEKAYAAQQKYMAEQARDEYNRFAVMHQLEGRTSQPPADAQRENLEAPVQQMRRIPKPNQRPANTSTYAPPVHVMPTPGAFESLGDEPKRIAYQNPVQQNPIQQVAHQIPVSHAQSGQNANNNYYPPTQAQEVSSFPRTGNASHGGTAALPVAPVAQRTVPQTQRVATLPQPRQSFVSQQIAPTAQMTTRRQVVQAPPRSQVQRPTARSNAETDYHMEAPVFPKAKLKGAPYILENGNTVGLQDRITSLLSKPRYREAQSQLAGSPQNQLTQNSLSQNSQGLRGTVSKLKSQVQRLAQTSTGPTPLVDTGFQQQFDENRRIPRQPRQPLYQAPLPPTVKGGIRRSANRQISSSMDIQSANEMNRRIEDVVRNQQRKIQQVALVEPKQDPFNDATITIAQTDEPVMRSPRGNYANPDSPDVTLPPVSLAQSDTALRTQLPSSQNAKNPMRQISILSQEDNSLRQDDNQFSQQPRGQEPANGEGVFGEEMDEVENIDDELRRMRNNQQPNDNPLSNSKIDDLVDELERKTDQEISDELDDPSSVIDDMDDDSDLASGNKVPVKSCHEFRNQLLDNSIRDIALDMSPPASRNRDDFVAISRNWTDQNGTVIATGTMVDLRRGYVIIDGVSGRQKIPYAKLSESDWAAISDYWQVPLLCSVGNRGTATRNWVPQTYTWKASAICHKPLYFENIQLERYGHSHGPFLQPVQSVAHFFTSMFTIPYQTALHPPNECQYALGFYRPGNCAPWLKDPIPISLDGIKRQALVSTGLGFIP